MCWGKVEVPNILTPSNFRQLRPIKIISILTRDVTHRREPTNIIINIKRRENHSIYVSSNLRKRMIKRQREVLIILIENIRNRSIKEMKMGSRKINLVNNTVSQPIIKPEIESRRRMRYPLAIILNICKTIFN